VNIKSAFIASSHRNWQKKGFLDEPIKSVGGLCALMAETTIFYYPENSLFRLIEEFEKFDLLYFELTWYLTCQSFLKVLRKKYPDTTIVAIITTIDRFWRNVKGEDISMHLEALKICDGVICTDRCVLEYWKHILPDQKFAHVTVPFPVEYYKKFYIEPKYRDRELINLSPQIDFYHLPHARRNSMASFLVYRKLKKKYKDLKAIAINSGRNTENEHEKIKRILSAMHIEDVEIIKSTPIYQPYIAKTWFGLQIQFLISQAQWSMSHAGLGVPLISSRCLETHKYLFPSLSIPWYDLNKFYETSIKLLTDDNFYDECIDLAQNRINYYSIEENRKRLNQFLVELFNRL